MGLVVFFPDVTLCSQAVLLNGEGPTIYALAKHLGTVLPAAYIVRVLGFLHIRIGLCFPFMNHGLKSGSVAYNHANMHPQKHCKHKKQSKGYQEPSTSCHSVKNEFPLALRNISNLLDEDQHSWYKCRYHREGQVQYKQDEGLAVVKSNAVVHPRTVMVHIQYAFLTF